MKVELISKTVGLGRYANLNDDEIISAIARHGTVKEDGGRLIKYLMNNKHWSPLQHISFGFLVETRRSISAQIFRHRSLHFQEWSLRYSEPLGFEDIELRKEHPTNRQSSTEEFDPEWTTWDIGGRHDGEEYTVKASEAIKEHFKRTELLYDRLVGLGVAKETVRDILPLATKTTIHVTGTLRDLLAFLSVRMDEHAQLEVRLIAERMGEELEKQLPNVFSQIDWRNGMFM